MINKFLCLGLLALGLQTSWAFSLLGPDQQWPTVTATFGDRWQVPEIGYNPLTTGGAPPFLVDPQQSGPKNLAEEYRRNTPVMYYAADSTFLDYFGSNGVVALDQTYGVLNGVLNGLTNAVLFLYSPTNGVLMGETNGVFNGPAIVLTNNLTMDSYSADLADFPLNSASVNYQAKALYLNDMKSAMLCLMMEQLGLADAVRYTWALHDRYIPTGASCPNGLYYAVVQRNFDITTTPLNQVQYSPYVNGGLYAYYVYENCDTPGNSPPSADAMELPIDPLFNNPPVASGVGEDAAYLGEFYTGLTRDDVAGLRYLLSTNNINWEAPSAGSLLISSTSGGTNYGPPFVLYTSNYTALVSSALTNDPATLTTLFPGLAILSTTTNFVGVTTTNWLIVTNAPIGQPYGSPPVVTLVPNGTTFSVVTNYSYTFANVITNNSFNTNTSAILLTVWVTNRIGQPYGSPGTTNTYSQKITLTNASGEYYINSNYLCGPNILLSVLGTNYSATTNLVFAATNPVGYSYSQSIVTYATNRVFVMQSPICAGGTTTGVTNGPGLYQGIGNMQFLRANYDSLLGQFFQPITTTYSMIMITNSQRRPQTFQRVVTRPDFLFSAADLTSGPGPSLPWMNPYWGRSINFNLLNINTNLSGPGTIEPSTGITLNKCGPVYFNVGTSFLTGPNNPANPVQFGMYFLWATFDGTTNDPVVFPNGTSIANLASEVQVQIFPPNLPIGTHGVGYSVTLSATGGQTPYLWSVASGFALPPGLNLDQYSGVISGTPTQAGLFGVTIQMTDAGNRTVSINYPITIN